MKLINISIITLIVSSAFFSSCGKNAGCMEGNGSVVTKEIKLSTINGVNLSGSMNAVISQGEQQQIFAVGHGNIISQLVTDVYDGVWDARLRDGCYRDYQLTLYITVPNINNVELSGSGNINIKDFTDQGDLSIGIQGSGDVTINKFSGAKNLWINIEGSGDIQANDNIESLEYLKISVDGSGEYRGFALSTTTCSIDIKGSADCEVNVRENLDVTIKGSGDIYYLGYPVITSKMNSSGSIQSAN